MWLYPFMLSYYIVCTGNKEVDVCLQATSHLDRIWILHWEKLKEDK